MSFLGGSMNEKPQTQPTVSQIKELRGQYFTVRHIPLTDCGHKMDVINEPRHRTCENCFWQWMNFHPQLVSTVNEAWQEHGKEFIIRLRGKWFATMFARYMATVVRFKEEENGKIQTSVLGGIHENNVGIGTEAGEGQEAGTVEAPDQRGENQSGLDSREIS